VQDPEEAAFAPPAVTGRSTLPDNPAMQEAVRSAEPEWPGSRRSPMVIGIASGKGGTGKTTVAVSLAIAAARNSSRRPLLLDCDVEEPNAGLFLDVDYSGSREAGVQVPQVLAELCTACGRCAEVCEWNAIAVAAGSVMVFEDLCHGCGSCTLNCPEEAIIEVMHVTGTIESGSDGKIDFARGVLDVGQAMPVPVISDLLREHLKESESRDIVIDCSPGTSCPMVTALSACECAILVTEPTPFGLHDLRAAVDVAARQLGLPCGVLVNRAGVGGDEIEDFCREENLPMIGRIPMDMEIASVLSEGVPLIEAMPNYGQLFHELLEFAHGSSGT
jgi:MinD superfamily P-loop ATPase